MYWLIGRRSQLSMENKLLLYKTIIQPVWTYGIQLWGTASTTNINILQRFQSEVLWMIVDAPWYVLNEVIHKNLGVPMVMDDAKRFAREYKTRLQGHPNELASRLTDNRP